MTEITNEKKRLLAFYAKRDCKLADPNDCKNRPCTCAVVAEFRAIKNLIIPKDFRNFTIRDFHGRISENSRLSADVALRAKRQVFEYCWGDLKLLERLPILSDKQLEAASVISERIKNGQNVIIHGGSKRQLSRSSDQKTNAVTELPLGRTFIASILTNEAIKLRLDNEFRNFSYEWIEFAPFLQDIKDESGENRLHYEGCEWLVVDDITNNLLGASGAHKAFAHQILDSFFAKRIRLNRATVLVFKFDIQAHRLEMESAFGPAIMKIINDKKTFVINLNDNAAKE